MPIGFSDGSLYEDELHVVGGVGDNVNTGRPQITITKQQHPFDKALDHLRTDDPIGTFIQNETGRTQAPMPRPDPRGSRPTYEEGEPIPGPDSYGQQTLGGREYRYPDMINPDQDAPSITPRYNPETTPLTPPNFKRVSDSDLSSSPQQPQTRRSAWDKLTGSDGGERYQLWPERAVREVLDNVRTFATTEPGSEANIQAAARMSFDLGLGGLAMAQKNAAGIFGGMLGGARKDPAIKEMLPRLEKAIPEEEVTRLTGWWKDPADKQWKFEIPDKGAKLDTKILNEMNHMAKTNEVGAAMIDLDGLLKHDKLFSVYPELQSYKVYVLKDLDTIATFSPSRNEIYVGERFMKMTDTEKTAVLLHEIQHGVQHIEGFAKGGRPNATASGIKAAELEKHLETASDKVRKDPGLPSQDVVNEIGKGYAKLEELKKRAYNEYRNIAGESEAHNIEYRYYLDMLGRQKPSPKETVKEVTKNFK